MNRHKWVWPGVATIWLSGAAWGTDLGQVDGYDVRLDVTIAQTMAWRVESPNAALLANINGDDGDRAFAPGLISARSDMSAELTVEKGDFGIDLSGQGWYDPVYLGRTADRSPQSFNPDTVPYYDHPADVGALMGRDAQWRNAYVKDMVDIGGIAVSVRVGQQTLLWGESLFFAANGIAGGQAPVDEIKALSNPLAPARDLYLPVPQAVVRAELTSDLALELYDQFAWRRDFLPGVTSYFSTSDMLDIGGQRLLLPPLIEGWNGGYYAYDGRTADQTPHGAGQFGVALRWQQDDVDLGLYALRYASKSPQPVVDVAQGTYRLVYPSDIDMLGASISTYAGDDIVAGEMSVRSHMPLLAGGTGLASSAATGGYGAAYGAATAYGAAPYAAWVPVPASVPPVTPQYDPQTAGLAQGVATGETWQAQASLVSQLPPSHWWQGASLQAEIAVNDLLAVTDGRDFVQPGRTHFAAAAQIAFTPSYFRVLPGLDISLPIGLGYTPIGRSSIDAGENAGAGDVTVSLSATYHTVWRASLSFTHFIGSATVQDLADRDFVSASLARSF